jgi:hypothetical protein
VSVLDQETLRRFVELAGDRLTGDWVIIGGCVLHLLGIGQRTTFDIDVAGPKEAGMDQAVTLMELAEELGLPVEAINQAGAFFLRRIEAWEEEIVAVHRGETATFHVPSATLFLLLKLGRLTEADLSDCILIVEHARERQEPIDAERVAKAARRVLAGAVSEGHAKRIEVLLAALG